MVARCGAGIRVEVVDRANGKVYDGDLPDVFLEVRSEQMDWVITQWRCEASSKDRQKWISCTAARCSRKLHFCLSSLCSAQLHLGVSVVF
jgi:hypothetical protein